MAEASIAAEIIDLTQSTPSTPKSANTDNDASVPESNRRARRAKKRKEAKVQEEDPQPPPERNLKRKSPDTSSERPPARKPRKSLADETQASQRDPVPAAPSSPTEGDLFFVDVEPTAIAQPPQTQPEPVFAPEPEPDQNTLLLPGHVTVFGSTPVEIHAPTTSLEDDSIQFLDYDDSKQFARYYQTEEQKAPSRTVCKKCGAENQHKTSECTVVICLTCGVRDEHPTRSCPISKVCFNCGMKGHISSKCPNRHTKGIPSSRFMDCDRCYSSKHKTNECPTWWRMYLYLSDEGRAKVLRFREERHSLPLGEGGEGYVANDEWCYNCGDCGHWGDDCLESNPPAEHSAFSYHNVASGPFYDPSKDGESSKKSKPRRKESFRDLEHVPDDVGRMGKEKSKSKLGKMLKDRADDDDQDDWFSKAGSGRGSARQDGSKKAPPTGPRGKTSFNFNAQSFRDRREFQPGTSGGSSGGAPSLLSRLGDTYQKDSTNEKAYGGYQGEGLNGNGSSKSSNKRKKDRKDRPRSPEQADYRSRGGSNNRRNDRGDRRDRYSNGGGGGPRYRGSYNR
ncbi:hypothetical protein DFP72DRAFT_876431 [Ephemerocybe angulata]|uniref:CCHC-type domain-containing protein n=1 Tax=Ephemerocybe angulata TaxID=980116 RepID=A0A8H6MBU3_9AGAR|nr:hypothetical protein DFP72DRAFT_876431 [Tulosesus angulatus]